MSNIVRRVSFGTAEGRLIGSAVSVAGRACRTTACKKQCLVQDMVQCRQQTEHTLSQEHCVVSSENEKTKQSPHTIAPDEPVQATSKVPLRPLGPHEDEASWVSDCQVFDVQNFSDIGPSALSEGFLAGFGEAEASKLSPHSRLRKKMRTLKP